MKEKFEDFVRRNKNEFEEPMPGLMSEESLMRKIEMHSIQKREKFLFRHNKIRWFAAAILLIMTGGILFYVFHFAQNSKNEQDNNKYVQTKNGTNLLIPKNRTADTTKTDGNKVQEEIVKSVLKIPNSVQVTANVKYVRFNKLQSTSKKISCLSAFGDTKIPDKELIDLFVKTMNEDPNTNVRLASLEALSKFSGEKYVKKKLAASLTIQKDPMVQIALIRLLTKIREVSIVQELQKIAEDVNSLDAVKDYAYEGLFKLNM